MLLGAIDPLEEELDLLLGAVDRLRRSSIRCSALSIRVKWSSIYCPWMSIAIARSWSHGKRHETVYLGNWSSWEREQPEARSGAERSWFGAPPNGALVI